MPGELQGRRALVTGATRGIGARNQCARRRSNGIGHGAQNAKAEAFVPADIAQRTGALGSGVLLGRVLIT